MRTVTRIILGAVLVVVLGVSPASAEWYVGGYVGVAIPDEEDVDVGLSAVGIPIADGTFKDVDLETSAVFGGKVGYFFESVPYFGLELEGYNFQPDADAQTVDFSGTVLGVPAPGPVPITDIDIDVIGIGLNAVYRLQLGETDAMPRGRFQPYFGLGLGIFIADLETTIFGLKADDTDTALGFQGLVGFKYFLIEHLALFAEYKFIQTDDFEFEDSTTVLGVPVKGSLETDLTAHLIYGGIAWHF